MVEILGKRRVMTLKRNGRSPPRRIHPDGYVRTCGVFDACFRFFRSCLAFFSNYSLVEACWKMGQAHWRHSSSRRFALVREQSHFSTGRQRRSTNGPGIFITLGPAKMAVEAPGAAGTRSAATAMDVTAHSRGMQDAISRQHHAPPAESVTMLNRLARAAGCTLALVGVRQLHAVSYVAEFAAEWSAATHPGAYPAGAHFSRLIGGVHNGEVSFWTPGGLASPGIEQMAEVGGVSLLRGEVESAIDAGAAAAVILGAGVNSPGSTTVAFDVTSELPLVTLVTMVAPTPDWFVGVHGLDLRAGDGWKDETSVSLYAYDAGTEEGTGFSLNNPATVPPAPIDLLAFPLAPSDPPLATLTFTRVPEAADFDGDGDVDAEDFNAWRAGFGLSGTATSAAGDADGDQDVDGYDFLAWQRRIGGATSVAATRAVPEPATMVMAGFAVLAIQAGRMARRAPCRRRSTDVGM
jgi:hypothetical protein